MNLTSANGRRIEVRNEPAYTFGSTDNKTRYASEHSVGSESRQHSTHGVLVDERPEIVLGASGGPTVVHENSACVLGEVLFVAVGDQLACISIAPVRLKWCTKVDMATCFGVHYAAEHDAIISHGELAIARLSRDGGVLWETSGGDVFTEGLSLNRDYIEAIDFNRRRYRFSYADGHPV